MTSSVLSLACQAVLRSIHVPTRVVIECVIHAVFSLQPSVPWLYIGQVLSQISCHRRVTWRPQFHQSHTRNMTIKSVRGMAPAVGLLAPESDTHRVKIILPTCTRNAGNVKTVLRTNFELKCNPLLSTQPADAHSACHWHHVVLQASLAMSSISIPPWASGVHLNPLLWLLLQRGVPSWPDLALQRDKH